MSEGVSGGSVTAIRFVAVLTTGLIAGILLGDRMGASFARPALSASGFVAFQQVVHANFVRMMPVLLGIAVLSSLAWLLLARRRLGTAGLVLLGLGTLALVAVTVITRMVNVPINDQLMTWSAASPPPDVWQIWARWEQTHTVRTVIAVLGFGCEVAAFGSAKR